MSSQDLISQFDALCSEIAEAEESYSERVEDSYEKLLSFIIEHAESRPLLSTELISIVSSFRHARSSGAVKLSIDAIAFCMHELRWIEVRDAAQFEHHECFSRRLDSTLLRLVAAFDDNWDEAEDYARFRDASNQLSPMS